MGDVQTRNLKSLLNSIMETKDILVIVIPVISAIISVISVFINFSLNKKAKRDDAIFKYKEEKYGNLIVLIQGFLDNDNKNRTETQKKFFEEQYKSWLYASDEVIIAEKNMVEKLKSLKQGETTISDIAGELIITMRKDMLKNTNLKPSDFQFTIVGNGK
jgi:hypothetical protein